VFRQTFIASLLTHLKRPHEVPLQTGLEGTIRSSVPSMYGWAFARVCARGRRRRFACAEGQFSAGRVVYVPISSSGAGTQQGSKCPAPPVPISSLGLFLFPEMAVMMTNIRKEAKVRHAHDQPCER
jgi:hypothetical protein